MEQKGLWILHHASAAFRDSTKFVLVFLCGSVLLLARLSHEEARIGRLYADCFHFLVWSRIAENVFCFHRVLESAGSDTTHHGQ